MSSIVQANIALNRSEAQFYEAVQPNIYNLWEQRRLSRELARFSRGIRASAWILDIGSGTGNLVKYLKKRKVVACDVSADMLMRNPSQYKVVCDASHLPFRVGVVSGVTGYSVLHHLPDVPAAIRECVRVAQKRARLYFDHDYFAGVRKVGFNWHDLMGWVLWLGLHPALIWRLLRYVTVGRRLHVQVLKSTEQAEDVARVDVPMILAILSEGGFHIQIRIYKGGSLLRAVRW